MTDLKEELEAEPLDAPEPWNPSEGDTITGRVIDHKQARTRDGHTHIYVLDPEEGGDPVALWMYAYKLERAEREGRRVALRYDGEHPATGRDLFTVRIDSD